MRQTIQADQPAAEKKFMLAFVVVTLIWLVAIGLHRRPPTESASVLWQRYADFAPPIAVIAPAYNEELSFEETTKALLALHYPDFEVLVVNVGSKDATLQVLIDKFGGENAESRRAEMVKQARREFDTLERCLDGSEWIASTEFTVADVLLATVLRQIRNTDLLDPYPRLKTYYQRTQARPAWERTLNTYAERLGVAVADIR